MAAKAILVLCAQALLIQTALSQCVSPVGVDSFGVATPFGPGGHGWAHDGLGFDNLGFGHNWAYNGIADAWPAVGLPCSGFEITPTAGGLLPVTSTSAIPPIGITVVSENAYEGLLAVAGEVPFVGTTGMEGSLLTGGTGAINYGCGNGVTAMVSEVAPAAFAPGIAAITPAAAVAAPVIATAAFAPGFASNTCGSCDHGYLF